MKVRQLRSKRFWVALSLTLLLTTAIGYAAWTVHTRPVSDNIYDLGTLTKRYRDGFFSRNVTSAFFIATSYFIGDGSLLTGIVASSAAHLNNATEWALFVSTFNATYDAQQDTTIGNCSVTNSCPSVQYGVEIGNCSVTDSCASVQYGTEVANTSTEMKSAINDSSVYDITSWKTYTVDNTTERTLFETDTDTNTANTSSEMIAALNETTGMNFTAVNEIGFKDNFKAYFGDDNDVCAYFDGTSFIISSSC